MGSPSSGAFRRASEQTRSMLHTTTSQARHSRPCLPRRRDTFCRSSIPFPSRADHHRHRETLVECASAMLEQSSNLVRNRGLKEAIVFPWLKLCPLKERYHLVQIRHYHRCRRHIGRLCKPTKRDHPKFGFARPDPNGEATNAVHRLQ